MKKLILLLTLIATSAFADTQTSIFFNPRTSSLTVYREADSNWRYNFALKVSDLSEPQQTVVSAALDWLEGQLDEDEALSQIIFEAYLIPDDPETTEDDESGLGLLATITGRKPNGAERTLPDPIDSKDVPSEVRTGLVGLWVALASIPAPAPSPTPVP